MLRILIFLLFSMVVNAFEFSDKTVIIVNKEDKILKNAANDLSFYIENITGVKPAILAVKPKNTEAIILTKLKEKSQLKDDGFIIKSQKNHLHIIGSSDNSVYYGVYYFLEHYLGCRFLSNSYEYIPKFSKKSLGDIYDVQEPRFDYREIFIAESDDWVYSLKNGLNGRLGHRTVIDSTQNIYPEGAKLYSFSSHSLLGKDFTCQGQYDFLNEDAQKKALKTLRKKLSQLNIKNRDYIMLPHEDRNSYCSHGLKNEYPSSSFLEYTSFLASSNPQYNFLSQSYLWSRKPPKKAFKLPKNLGIMFSGIESNFAKPLYDKQNKAILQDIESWSQFTDDVFIWHYITNFGGYMLPFPDLYAVDKDIKTFSKLPHIKGIFLQGSYETFGGELASLRIWVFAKLLWNPDLDLDLLIKEFCDYYYGNASADVQLYIKTLHQFIDESDDELSVKTSINTSYLNTKNLNRLDKILSHGLKQVENNSAHKKHVIAIFSGIDYVRLLRGDKVINKEKVKKRFKTFLLENPNISAFAEGVKIDNIVKIIDLDRKHATIPDEAKGIKKELQWFEYQEYELKLCCTDLVADGEASDGVSAKMSGDKEDWGFSLPLLNLPKGEWDVYASVKIELFDDFNILDNTKMALFYGIYPTNIKGASIVGQFTHNKYQNIKIGTIDSSTSNAQSVWLSPPANDVVKYVYVDRIFIVSKIAKFE